MNFDRFKNFLAEQFGVDDETITMNTRFVEDLGADSLDLADMVCMLESELPAGVIEDEQLYQLKTVGDVMEYLGSINTSPDTKSTNDND